MVQYWSCLWTSVHSFGLGSVVSLPLMDWFSLMGLSHCRTGHMAWQVEQTWISYHPQTWEKHPRSPLQDQVHTLVHRTLGEQGFPDMTIAPLSPQKLRVGSPVLVDQFKGLRRQASWKTLSSQLPWLSTCQWEEKTILEGLESRTGSPITVPLGPGRAKYPRCSQGLWSLLCFLVGYRQNE